MKCGFLFKRAMSVSLLLQDNSYVLYCATDPNPSDNNDIVATTSFVQSAISIAAAPPTVFAHGSITATTLNPSFQTLATTVSLARGHWFGAASFSCELADPSIQTECVIGVAAGTAGSFGAGGCNQTTIITGGIGDLQAYNCSLNFDFIIGTAGTVIFQGLDAFANTLVLNNVYAFSGYTMWQVSTTP